MCREHRLPLAEYFGPWLLNCAYDDGAGAAIRQYLDFASRDFHVINANVAGASASVSPDS